MDNLIKELKKRAENNSHYSSEKGQCIFQVYKNALEAAEVGNKDRVKTELGFLLGLGGDEHLVEYEKLLALLG